LGFELNLKKEMQIDEKGIENLLMNIMLKKYFKKTQIQKTPFHAFLLGIFG
jgi:hypothetical protein